MAYVVEEIPCPICGKGKINVRYTPRMLVTRYSHAASNRKAMNYRTHEKLTVVSGCSECGKTREEIEKAYRQEKPPSREDIIRRAKAAGLPLRF